MRKKVTLRPSLRLATTTSVNNNNEINFFKENRFLESVHSVMSIAIVSQVFISLLDLCSSLMTSVLASSVSPLKTFQNGLAKRRGAS